MPNQFEIHWIGQNLTKFARNRAWRLLHFSPTMPSERQETTLPEQVHTVAYTAGQPCFRLRTSGLL